VKPAVLIPAHDEEPHIADAVRCAREAGGPALSLFVVADRCADATAARAEAAGARVFVRSDGPPGKGAALAWFLDAAAAELAGVDALLVLDADSRLQAGAVEALGRALDAGADAAQGFVRPLPGTGSPASMLSAFSEWIAQAVVDRLRRRLRCPVPLRGTGMAIRLDVLREVAPLCRTRVEDAELTLLLLDRRRTIAFVPEAVVEDPKPPRFGGVVRQRARWLQGQCGLLGRYPGLILKLLLTRGLGDAWLVLSLLLKPKTFFLALRVALAATLCLLADGPVLKALAVLATASLAPDVVYYAIGWLTVPKAWRWPVAGALLCSPLYAILWAAASVLGLFSRKPWLRARE
jgi:cellulose synthase/poly-beta-1,6-N-acetylglucosamine synthase-like glycosyltransferase